MGVKAGGAGGAAALSCAQVSLGPGWEWDATASAWLYDQAEFAVLLTSAVCGILVAFWLLVVPFLSRPLSLPAISASRYLQFLASCTVRGVSSVDSTPRRPAPEAIISSDDTIAPVVCLCVFARGRGCMRDCAWAAAAPGILGQRRLYWACCVFCFLSRV